jgi:serine/threonine protein kinase
LDLAGAAFWDAGPIAGSVTQAASGPLEYMAPEVLAGCSDPSSVADVWSAAAVMGYVFTGSSLFGQSPADRGQALTNVLEVLGRMSPLEIEEFRQLPHWSEIYEVAAGGTQWYDGLAANPGAEMLLRRMLIFGWKRC